MSILDEIDKLDEKTKALQELIYDGQKAIREEVAAGVDLMKKEAEALATALADAQARSFHLKLASGREVVVSERDALQLFAALPICLRRDTAKLELASGQTEDFKLTDLEQLADAIVAANFHQPQPAINGAGQGASP